jgi:hypothetical protein
MSLITEHTDAKRKAILETYPPPHVFAVITWGCAASSWLARTLNSHPDIYCVHTANSSWAELGGAPHLDGSDYLTVIGSQGYAHIAAGDVHGVSRHTVPELKATFGEQFSCAIVVREPLSRLRSQLALFKKFQHLHLWNVEYLDDIINNQKLPLPDNSYSNHLFVHGANMLNAIVEEHLVAPIYRSEDLTSDAEILCNFVDHLTNGKVKADLSWATTSICRDKLNVHAEAAVKSPKVEDLKLEDWQIATLQKVVLPQAWELYHELKYPIPSFL